MMGIWDLPVFRQAKDLVKYGLDNVSKSFDMRSVIDSILPVALSTLTTAVPEFKALAGPLEVLIRQLLTGNKGDH